MTPLPKKFFLVLLLLLSLSLSQLSIFTPPAHAQPATSCVVADLINLIPWLGPKLKGIVLPDGPWYNQNTCQFNRKVFDTSNPDEMFGERYTYAQLNWIVNSLQAMLNPFVAISQDLNNFINAIKNLFASGSSPTFSQYAQLGLPGLLVGTMSDMYSHPVASGTQSVSNFLAKFDPVPTVSAQGYGFGSLVGFQRIWSASRNMVYFLMVVLLIASGFMIIFRVKINPQTAITLQLMIPKIIMALILVTFSFAIAGFVIDFIYLIIGLVVNLLNTVISPPILGNPTAGINLLTSSDYGKLFWYFMTPWIAIFAAGGIATLLAGAAGPLAPFVLPAMGAVGIVNLILGIVFIWLLFKVWWMLLKTYLNLLLLIIVGPWQIMLGLLPGQSGFGTWFRNIIAHASVFVVVPLMFLFTLLVWNIPVVNPVGPVDTGTGLFMTLPNLPFQDGNGIIFNFAIGYAILALIPKVADMVRDALKIPPFKYGTAFGEALSPATLGGRFGAQAGANWVSNIPGGWANMSGLEKAMYSASQVGRTMGIVK